MADGKLITGDEEKILKQILNAEDKELDREWHKKVIVLALRLSLTENLTISLALNLTTLRRNY